MKAAVLTPGEWVKAYNAWHDVVHDPVLFAERVLGVPLWARQVEILEAIRDHREVYVHSGNGVGKDYTAAVATIWLLFSGYLVVTTATSGKQVDSILWAEIRSMRARAKIPLGGEIAPSASWWSLAKTVTPEKPKWFATGITAKEQNALQGHHFEKVACIGDEAAGLFPWVFDALAGCAVGPYDKLVYIGNPTAGLDHPFIKTCGRGSKPGLRKVIHISSLESPNYVARKNLIPGLFSVEAEELAADKWGRDSTAYRARVLGLLPTSASTSLIGYQHISAAHARFGALSETERATPWRKGSSEPVRLGCDVARFGEDLTTIWACQGARVWRLEKVTQWDGVAIAKRLSYHAKALAAASAAIDGGGLGSGPVDSLRDLQRRGEAPADLQVFDVNFGASPSADLEKDVYDKRTELYWRLRDWLDQEGAVELEESVVEELITPTYGFAGSPQRIKLEPKADLKKRLQRSPDDGDGLALAVSGHRGGAVSLVLAHGRGAEATPPPYDPLFDDDLWDKRKGDGPEGPVGAERW